MAGVISVLSALLDRRYKNDWRCVRVWAKQYRLEGQWVTQHGIALRSGDRTVVNAVRIAEGHPTVYQEATAAAHLDMWAWSVS